MTIKSENIMKQKTKGFGLLEALMVLSVIILGITVSVRYYESTQNQQKINQTINRFELIASALTKTLATSNTEDNGSNSLVDSIWSNSNNLNETLESSGIISSSTLKSPWTLAGSNSEINVSIRSGRFSGARNACCESGQTCSRQSSCLYLVMKLNGADTKSLAKLYPLFCSVFADKYPTYRQDMFAICLQ